MEESIDDIFGMLNIIGKKYTVSDIRSDPVLGVYVIWKMYCSVAGQMYQPGSTCGSHDDLSFGLL